MTFQLQGSETKTCMAAPFSKETVVGLSLGPEVIANAGI